jgi:hypothetical protein
MGMAVIPDYAAMHWIVRAPTAKEVGELRDRVKNCIKCVIHTSDFDKD